jgi:adenosine deaminase
MSGAPVGVPLAELHVHLEGTAPPALIRRLAERHGVPVPADLFRDPETFAWDGFLDFLRAYDRAASVVRTAADYQLVTADYLRACAAEGAIYVELLASPDHAAAVGLDDAEHFGAIAAGIEEARAQTGIEARVIACAVRNLGAERAEAIARRLATGRHPSVVGFNLVGDEAGYPPGLFAEAFRIADGAGLGCACHAGEHAGAESVRAALELPLRRISHGVRAAEDPALVAEIAARGLVLEVCPTSNVATGVYPSHAAHPLGSLREAGVKLTLGSDDPPWFAATIAGEYAVARDHHGFGEQDLWGLTRTAVEASFAEEDLKVALLNRLTPAPDRGAH